MNKKKQLHNRVMNARLPLCFWPKFILATIVIFFLCFFFLFPAIILEFILEKIFGVAPALVHWIEDFFNKPGFWAMHTIDRYADRKEHRTFFLELYEE